MQGCFAVSDLAAAEDPCLTYELPVLGRQPPHRYPVLQLLSPCCVLSVGIERKHTDKETHMETLTTKLAALAGTLFMNTLVMGAVAYCFALQPNTYMTAVALAKAVATQQGLA
jgi:hypothetical protein